MLLSSRLGPSPGTGKSEGGSNAVVCSSAAGSEGSGLYRRNVSARSPGGLTRGPWRVQPDARVERRGSLPLVHAAEAVRSQAADGPGGL